MNLFERSIEIILENQAASGAYVASPSFPTYRYCWFRDGAFIAYAMDLAGQPESARRFHAWAAQAVLQRAEVVRQARAKVSTGQPLDERDYLHTRYHLDGQDGEAAEWPNFQLDGFGTWLWALSQHLRRQGGRPPQAWEEAAGLVASYLEALWPTPCYDCWEEFPDHIHTHTLAAVYGGLEAASQIDGCDRSSVLAEIRSFLRNTAVRDGYFVKFPGSAEVDASLLGLAVPYRVLQPGDELMRRTVEQIEAELMDGGGLHRYRTDTYYGGGAWVLLTAWLGWYYAEVGQIERARSLLAWVEAQAGPDGSLPEQVPLNLNDAAFYQPWLERWGPVANPLLWSHAKYIILKKALGDQA